MNRLANKVNGFIIVLCLNSTVACNLTDHHVYSPAVIVQPSTAAHREITAAISSLLKGQPVTLASDIFSTTDTVSIERKVIYDNKGNPIQGRVLSAPVIFRLTTNGKRCVIEQADTLNAIALQYVKCRKK